MAHAIFYSHQTSGACADMCMCNCMHQMENCVTIDKELTFDKDVSKICSKEIKCFGENIKIPDIQKEEEYL